MNVRAAAAEVIAGVLRGKSLSALLPDYSDRVSEKDRPLFKEMCFGTLRWYPQIAILLKQLLAKPLREKDLEIQGLLACGLYQLMFMRIAEHAVLNETVAATQKLNRRWAKGLVNAVLRNYQRHQQDLQDQQQTSPVFQTAHPKWLLKMIEDAWTAEKAEQIISANNHQAPMTLRVNILRGSRDSYMAQLADAEIKCSETPYSNAGILLASATDVSRLPEFASGALSVQDEAAQLAAPLLMLEPGQAVLDACCAPGGKTCHIAETEPDLAKLVAVDLEPRRLTRVEENLQRLGLEAQVMAADAGDLQQWWDGQVFDRVLIDAPCSASGVIRRHPDIKILRKPADIAKLSAIQLQLVNQLWQTLNDGGILLYATCSVLPAENDQVIRQFLAENADASLLTIEADWGIKTDCGRQLFPEINGNDGFYYSRLQKTANNNSERP
ncbi:MAG: 16S rRNA (cytosine(967)-C(5))-methyltransferase RsmB [Porticoccaceae bacterium]